MGPDLQVRAIQSGALAATCATAAIALAVAMGVGRFAFTPLLPLMIRDGTIPADAGAWLAASNYLGYLLGALTASLVPLRSPALMSASLVGIAILTAAMGHAGGSGSQALLRFAAGVLSAWALVATSAWALGSLARAGASNRAGMVYAGVGLGIALVGLYCIVAARPGVPVAHLWLELGVLSALASAAAVVGVSLSRPPDAAASRPPASSVAPPLTGCAGLVISYGLFGFGYILPATFLPALAREVVSDPQVFGLAWPLFGLAAAVSTVLAAVWLARANRLRAWAASHVLMAVGVILPSLWLSAATIAIAALLVGSTFMVVTMLGMQEARALRPANPTAILGAMTAAFATGQLAGPVASGALSLLLTGHSAALDLTLAAAAIALVGSAAYLWSLPDPRQKKREGD